MDYSLEVTKLVSILKSPSIPEGQKMVAENRLREIRYLVTKDKYNLPEDRIDDVMQLESMIADPRTPENHRAVAKRSLQKIVNESSIVRSMRKSLVREMKKGNVKNVLDINDFVSRHSKYRND